MTDRSQGERLRRNAREIFDTAVKAADPGLCVEQFVKRADMELIIGGDLHLDLTRFGRILVVGAGKATAAMAQAIERLLGDLLTGGLICVKYGHCLPLKRIEVVEAAHPVPDNAGEEATERIMDLLRSAGERDLVLSLISGGGSALLPAPADPVTLLQKQQITEQLLSAGATIQETNTVRKHLSRSKGGGLMRTAYPATVINLMLSDVIGDDPEIIASGPFVPDSTTFTDARRVLERYDLLDSAPPRVLERIRKGVDGTIHDTPKSGDPIFDRVTNLIVGSNIGSLLAAADTALELGYDTLVLSSTISGDTTEAAQFHAALAEEILGSGNPVTPPACLISGGETTVKVRGTGLGGRNQEFALALVERAAAIPGTLFFSAGTDGTDGPTDAAGAVVDSRTLERALAAGMDPAEYLRNNDSYHFFQELGDLVVTGPTGTNVMDVRIVLVDEP